MGTEQVDTGDYFRVGNNTVKTVPRGGVRECQGRGFRAGGPGAPLRGGGGALQPAVEDVRMDLGKQREEHVQRPWSWNELQWHFLCFFW